MAISATKIVWISISTAPMIAPDHRTDDDDTEDEVLKAGAVRDATSHFNHADGPPAPAALHE
mgnify:CR=1 FL=1